LYAYAPKTSSIEFITIATTGDASNFGDGTAARQSDSGTSSQTRAVVAGGEGGVFNSHNPNANASSPFAENLIDYVTIATLGNALDFGDRTVSGWGVGSTSNDTRGIFFGGNPSKHDVIDYITIATTGNATDFGDLSAGNGYADGASDKTRALIGGGSNPAATDTIEFVTIATTGDAIDFGDLSVNRQGVTAFSNSNGGLAS